MATRRAARHCSVCGSTRHDARAHGRVRRAPKRASARRNPEGIAQLERELDRLLWRRAYAESSKGRRGLDARMAIDREIDVVKQRLARLRAAASRGAAGKPTQLRLFNPRNPDWFRDQFGRPHPIRSSPNYDEGAVGRKRSYRREVASSFGTGPRGGYTWEEPKGDRARRATRAGQLRRSGGGRGPSGAQVSGRLEALARGKTRAQKQNEKARRVASRGF